MKRGSNRLRLRGTRHWATPLVLAMLCLRALVPAGFMLAPIDGRLQIVLCDSAAPARAPHHQGHDHGAHRHAIADPNCPYAQSAGPAPLPALPMLAAAPVANAPAVHGNLSQTHVPFGPVRQHSPRAPPLLA
jgi:hypothetical protein